MGLVLWWPVLVVQGEGAVVVVVVGPAGAGLLGVVVPAEGQGEVLSGGRSALGERHGVIRFAAVTRLVAGGEPADVVAGGEVVAESLCWPVAVWADVQQRSGVGVGEQPAPGAGGIGGQPSRGPGGDGSVAGEMGGLVVQGEQGVGRDDDVDGRPAALHGGQSVERQAGQPMCSILRRQVSQSIGINQQIKG